jgi:DNA polymerase-3 subunit gamma/tau
LPYLTLYRKYRPRSFTEVVGQRHVTQTLVNAVKADRIAHAYLFCGPRGTGKTSTARVLAMAINCREGTDEGPCGDCQICNEIVTGSALDVFEFDAASHRRVEELAQVLDRVSLTPVEYSVKLYIIDEVHMLSGTAFNAFLKTLEEPPAHVVFVLATTEPHSVLPTILSRCQRFDFHRVGLRDIESNLRTIAEKEDIGIGDRAVTMLAHAADGSVRDSLTLLDQAVAYAEGEVTPEVVTEILGGIDFDLLAEFADVLTRRDVAAALALVDRVVAEGKHVRQLVAGLIEHYRNLLVVRVDRRARETLALPEDAARRVNEQAQSLSPEDIARTLNLFAETDRELRFTSQPRLLLELCAVRICRAGEPAAAPAAVQPTAPTPQKTARAKRAARKPTEEGKPSAPRPQTVREPTGAADLVELRQRWDEVIAELRKAKRTSEAAFLRESVPAALEGNVLTLAFKHLFHHDQMRRDEKRCQVVAEAISRLFGLKVTVKCTLAESGSRREEEKGAKSDSDERTALDDVMSMFPGSELEE